MAVDVIFHREQMVDAVQLAILMWNKKCCLLFSDRDIAHEGDFWKKKITAIFKLW